MRLVAAVSLKKCEGAKWIINAEDPSPTRTGLMFQRKHLWGQSPGREMGGQDVTWDFSKGFKSFLSPPIFETPIFLFFQQQRPLTEKYLRPRDTVPLIDDLVPRKLQLVNSSARFRFRVWFIVRAMGRREAWKEEMGSTWEGSWQVGAGPGEGWTIREAEERRKTPINGLGEGGAGSRYYLYLILILPDPLSFSLLGVSSNMEEWPTILSWEPEAV